MNKNQHQYNKINKYKEAEAFITKSKTVNEFFDLEKMRGYQNNLSTQINDLTISDYIRKKFVAELKNITAFINQYTTANKFQKALITN